MKLLNQVLAASFLLTSLSSSSDEELNRWDSDVSFTRNVMILNYKNINNYCISSDLLGMESEL